MKTQSTSKSTSGIPESNAEKQASTESILHAYKNGTAQLATADNKEPIQQKENKTGLPDQLKSGVENLSGHSLDDVKVHYNSSQPAALQAHAYAQGTDIHVAPGQEKHLPHEAWHVVQQKQGRVQPTKQLKGKTNINDDAGLEKEADVMGNHALNFSSPENKLLSETPLIQQQTIQRRIQIGSKPKKIHQVYKHLRKNKVGLKETFEDEIQNKPKMVKEKAAENKAVSTDFGDKEKDQERIKSWDSEKSTYRYEFSEKGAEEVAKDTVKYYLYKKFDWLNIGVAAYMTGDVTGLLMATSLKDNVTLDVQKGKKENNETEKEWSAPENYKFGEDKIFAESTQSIEGVPVKDLMLHMNKRMGNKRGEKVNTPNFYSKETSTLPETFRHKNLDTKIVESDAAKEGYEGTRDAYKKKFDRYSGLDIRPWNKETYEATKMIGELYPDKKKEIEGMLLPENPNQNKAALKKIDQYRDSKVGGDNIILMWGRLSGMDGGAHTELDSNPVTMVQIAKKISKDFSSRTIVLIGDKVISASILQKAGVKSKIIDINTFWKDPFFKENAIPIGDRRYQHYLIQQMSKINDAVSIGMRSGSLEATALLGVKTIFLDDKGNNAEERMEFWSGGAAKNRNVKSENWETIEDQEAGPVKNYKRVATSRMTGDKIYSPDMKALLETLGKIEAVPVEKITPTAKDDAPKTYARIDNFAKRIKNFEDIKSLSKELATLYKEVISPESIKIDKDTKETVKIDTKLFEQIKTDTKSRLNNPDGLNIGLNQDELDQISGLTSHLIKKDLPLDKIEKLKPHIMRKKWRQIPIPRRKAIHDEVFRDIKKYPRIAQIIYQQQPE
jgi:hypothetical protein